MGLLGKHTTTLASLLLIHLTPSLVLADGAVELTLDNFESTIAGKNAFVKFLAPW